MNKLKIYQKFVLLSLVSIGALVIIGVYGLYNTHSTFQWVGQVYNTADSITKLQQNIGVPADRLRQLSLSVVLAPDKRSQTVLMNEQLGLVNQLRGVLSDTDRQVGSLGGRGVEAFANVRNAWNQYENLMSLTGEYVDKGLREAAFLNVTGAESRQFQEFSRHFSIWVEGQVHDATAVYGAATDNYIRAVGVSSGIILGFAVLVSLISVYAARNISNPLLHLNDQLKLLARGNLNHERVDYQGRDEIAEIVQSVNQLKQAIQTTISQANAIAAGNYQHDVNLLSEEDQLGLALMEMTQVLRQVIAQADAIASGDYSRDVRVLSEHDQLGQALANMTQTLREMTRRNEESVRQLAQENAHKTRQDWLKTGQMQLSQEMSGEQEMQALARGVIRFFCQYLGAQVGTFYIARQSSDEDQPHLKLIASYAYTKRKQMSDEYALGEGLVGQAALERTTLTVSRLPENYLPVQSSVGEAEPGSLLLAPFMYENQLKGLIELGSFQEFEDIHLEFLKQSLPAVGIAFNTAEARLKMKALLHQSQTLAEELQSQAEELQSQSEELQTQQEELRQTNEELEQRTRELERQQIQVQQQNSELQKSKDVIEAKAREVELASKYKSEFLANMSHELRTPLNSMLILAQLLSSNKEQNLTEKQQECARTIHSAGSDLLALINDILDLSKVEAGRIELHPEEFGVDRFTESLRQKFEPVATQKGLHFETVVDPACPTQFCTDFQRLSQVLINLLGNAFKFTPAGGTVSVKLALPEPNIRFSSGLNPQRAVAIHVVDTGIGIPKDKQAIIFEAFHQADGTTSRRFGGTGLGLSISRQMAQLMGGEIQVRSEEGEGSTFTLYIPYWVDKKTETQAAAPPRHSMLEPEARRMPSMPVTPKTPPKNAPAQPTAGDGEAVAAPRATATAPAVVDDREHLQANDRVLLVVEDDPQFSKILVDLAHEKGFKCLVAYDGASGLQTAEQFKPGAIMLDVGLPEVDGWTVMEHLKHNPETRHIPVHFVSGMDDKMAARRMGAIGYLLKPVNMGDLEGAFKRIEDYTEGRPRRLLVLAGSSQDQTVIQEFIQGWDVSASFTLSQEQAWRQLQDNSYDCLLLDVEAEQASGIGLLEQIRNHDQLSALSVIIYANRDLTQEEQEIIRRCEQDVLVKSVYSPERLLDEVTLFLHQVEARLPEDKRQMLSQVHNREAVLADKKVLVVDDDTRNTFALMSVLEEKDMTVELAANGREALEVLAQNPDVNIVLMDIMMPEMDGYETMRRIRAQTQFRNLPIIALTAKAMKGDKAKCIEAGANDYLSKPIDMAKLMSLMRVWLYR